MSNPDDVTITLHQVGEEVAVDIWSPAFVDSARAPDVESALSWARERCEGVDPFEAFTE